MSARFLFLAVALVWAQGRRDVPEREQKAPRPPASARPLPPVQEPFRTAVERQDLIQRFGKGSPLVGIYSLQSVVRAGAPPLRSKGFVVFGRRYLSMHLFGATRNPKLPAIQSEFRSYRIVGDKLLMTTMMGFRNTTQGDIVIQPSGQAETRRFLLLGTRLKIWMDSRSYMEFLRIE